MWILLLSLLLPLSANGSGDVLSTFGSPPSFLTPTDGLSDKTVFSICQGRRGFIWFGTLNGLNRYDGHEIKSYHHRTEDTTSLGENCVRAIFEDHRGTLWVGTWGGGVSRYLPEQDRFRSYHTRNSSLNDNFVTSLFEDHARRLWVGTRGGGLYQYRPGQNDFEAANDLQHPFHSVWDMTEDEAGNLWLATDQGLYRYQASRQEFTRFAHQPDDSASLSENILITLLIDHRGLLWIGTENQGLNRFDPQSHRVVRYPTSTGSAPLPGPKVRGLYEDHRGNLWVGSDRGLARYDRTRHHFTTHPAFRGEAVQALYQSYEGKVWIGTFHKGVGLINDRTRFTYRTVSEHGLSNGNVSALAADSAGRVFVGTTRGGVDILDTKTDQWSHLTQSDGLSSDHTISLAQGGQGVLWIGTWERGVNLYDTKQQQFIRYPELPTAFYETASFHTMQYRYPYMWLASTHQLYCYNERTRTLRLLVDLPRHIEEHQLISTFLIDHRQDAWIGSRSGLFQAAYPSYQRQAYPLSSSPVSVTALQEDRNHNLLVGTVGNHLYRINVARDHQRRIPLDAVSDGAIASGMIEDATGTWWIGSSQGIARLETGRQNDSLVATSILYDHHTALPSDYVNRNAFCQSDSLFWWGTNDGLVAFNPLRSPPHRAPPLALVDFEISNQDTVDISSEAATSSGKPIQLAAEQNNFTATFAALDYAAPRAIQYSFYLEGYDSAWRAKSPQRSVAYHHLAPGRYTLRARASDVDERWNSYRTITIHVLPSPWKTKKGYLACVGLLSLLVGLYYRFRDHSTEEEPTSELSTQQPDLSSALHEALLHQAQRVIDLHLTDATFSPEDFAREMGFSRTHLYTKIKQVTGLTVREFMKEHRLKKAAELLTQQHDRTVAEVAFLVGFSSYRYFSKCFKEKFGQSPSKFSSVA